MAQIVCQVLHRPNRVTFIWSEGAASFEPYHLQGQELDTFYQAAHSIRQHLLCLMQGGDPQAAFDLARSGYLLYQSIFRHNANDPQARAIQNWLNDLRDRNLVTSLDMLGDVPGRIPWNAVFDQEPAEQALRSGEPAALKAFWGFQYALAVGKRVNPLRVACVLDSPNILLVADTALLAQLPTEQKNLLMDWAISHELTVVDSVRDFRIKMGNEAPDILYVFARFEGGALHLGEESITLEQIRDLLATAKEGNPDPVVFFQVSGDPVNWEAWECFLGATVNALSGVIMCEVPASPALANVLGVDALARFLQNQRLGQALKEVRGRQDLAALAYSAFCPSHVKIAGDDNTDPDVPGPELLPLPTYPYHPLIPFESEDRGLFTGREDDTIRCAGLLDEAATRGLVLHGTGGVGKSSFLRAGLVPHLETEAVGYLALRDRRPEEQIGSESDYPVVALRPGYDLLGQLAEARVRLLRPTFYLHDSLRDHDQRRFAGNIKSSPGGGLDPRRGLECFAEPCQPFGRPSGFIDTPFALRIGPGCGAGGRFGSSGQGASSGPGDFGPVLRSPARCKVILSVRTEYLGRLMDQIGTGPERGRTYFLDELSEDQMLRAILLPTAAEPVPYGSDIPLQKYHFTFEPAVPPQLVKDILRAAGDKQHSPLPLLQTLCADLYERVIKRRDDLITKTVRKNQGPAEEAVVRLVDKKLKDLPLAAKDRQGLRKVMDQLYLRHTDGTITRALVPAGAVGWKSSTPLETVVDAAAEEGLIDASPMLVEGRQELFLSLPQEALAQAAAQWDEDRKRQAFGRTRIMDTLWIMIPLLFLVGAVIWTFTKNTFNAPEGDIPGLEETFAKQDNIGISNPYLKVKSKELEDLFRSKEKLALHLERDRWSIYVGDMVLAEQAWKNKNPLLARQILLPYQTTKNEDMRDFEWYYLWNKVADKGPEAADKKGTNPPPPEVIAAHEGAAQAVLFILNDKAVVSGGRDGTVKFWDTATGKSLAKLTDLGGVTCLAFSFQDNVGILAAGTRNDKNEGDVRLWETTWDAKEGLKTKELPALKGHAKGVTCLAFSPDGKTLASGSVDQTAILWDTSTKKQKNLLKGHEGEIRCLAFSLKGENLITGGSDGKMRRWDTKEGKEIGPLYEVHAGGVNALSFILDKLRFVTTVGADQDMKLWYWESGQQPKTFHTNHSNALAITSLAASPNFRFIATGSLDQTVKLYDTQLKDDSYFFGKERFTFTGSGTPILAVAVSLNSLIVASAGEDGTIHFWRATSPKEMMTESQQGTKK